MAVPLDRRHELRKNPMTGLMEDIPDLHPSLIETIRFVPYTPLPSDPSDQAALGEWIDLLEIVDDDLRWLLTRDHSKFWCQLIFDDSLKTFLSSYLRHSPRSLSVVPVAARDIHRSVHRRVFFTFVRLSTSKESPDNFLSDDAFAEIVYNHFLLDVPKMMDLCVLYGDAVNSPLLTKMLTNVFSKQKLYFDDLNSACDGIVDAFAKLKDRVEAKADEKWSVSEVDDVLHYVNDIGRTLSSFVRLCSVAAPVLAKHSIAKEVVSLFENLVPLLRPLVWRSENLREAFLRSKASLLSFVHSLVEEAYLKPIDAERTPRRREELADKLLELISFMLASSEFLKNYNAVFSIEEDWRRVEVALPSLDSDQALYIRDTMKALDVGRRHDSEENELTKEDHMIAKVKEVFPHLEEEFIRTCLEGCAWDAEKTIGSLLEDQGAQASETQEKKTEIRPDEVEKTEGVLSKRRNVFDDDEMDVFRSQELDYSRIRYKERNRDVSSKSVLDDKSFVSSMRDRFLNAQFDDYDDEYDDTHDSTVGAPDFVSVEDFRIKRLNEKLPLFKLQTSDDEEDEEEDGNDGSDKTKATTEMEHRRQGKGGAFKKGYSDNTGDEKKGPMKRQDQLKARAAKERYKGSYGNHNRKMGAQKKQGRAMGSFR